MQLRVYLCGIDDRYDAEGHAAAEGGQHRLDEIVVDVRTRRKAPDALAAVRADGGVVRTGHTAARAKHHCTSGNCTKLPFAKTMSLSKLVVLVCVAYSCNDSCSKDLSAPPLPIA